MRAPTPRPSFMTISRLYRCHTSVASVAYYRLVNTLGGRLSAFISAEGHIAEVDTSDNGTAVRFRSRGLKYVAWTMGGDDAYLQLSCAMTLEPGIIFDAPLLRALLECQDGFKCVKLSIQREGTLLVSAVESFFTEPDGYESTFWRSIGVIESAAYAGLSEIRNQSTKLAANKFIDELCQGSAR